MPYFTSPQALREAFVELPDNVRKWLASEKVLAVVSDMNERLEYFGDKISVIPWLITRLVVKDLAPKYFMSELRDYLVVSDDEARTITEEIDKRILRPIEPALNRLDIDLNSLYLGQPAPQIIEARKQESEKAHEAAPAPSAPVQFGIREEPIGSISPIRPIAPISPIKPAEGKMPEGPLILHTEKEEIPQTAHSKPGEAGSMPRPTFQLNIPQSKYKKPAAPPPVTVKIETPENVGSLKIEVRGEKGTGDTNTRTSIADHPSSNIQQTEGPKIMKVVHYSDFRTPLK